MKCKRCGTEGSPGAIFCLNCGMALPKEADEASASNKTMVLGPENKAADSDSGRTMILDSGKKEGSEKAPAAEEKAPAGAVSSAGATTQFIPREAMKAALAELKGGAKEAPPAEADAAPKPAAVSPEKPAEGSKPVTPVTTSPPPAAPPEKVAPASGPLDTAPIAAVTTPPPAAEPAKPAAPSAPPVAPAAPAAAASPALAATLGDIRSKLNEIEAAYAGLEEKLTRSEQKLAQTEQARAALQTSASGAVLQLKAVAAKDSQAQQELDYEGLTRLVSDLVANPRDIELITQIARRAQAIKRVMELHRASMEAINDANKAIEPLLGKS